MANDGQQPHKGHPQMTFNRWLATFSDMRAIPANPSNARMRAQNSLPVLHATHRLFLRLVAKFAYFKSDFLTAPIPRRIFR